ncbi:MAG: hypothetical protein CBD27_10400 [Rhodospirillaceae bacterium TMED167]|nr:MAG: hypothetical protein CBD27_10400 [Rhodospirillaceae bacterium TMED167]
MPSSPTVTLGLQMPVTGRQQSKQEICRRHSKPGSSISIFNIKGYVEKIFVTLVDCLKVLEDDLGQKCKSILLNLNVINSHFCAISTDFIRLEITFFKVSWPLF